MLPFCWCLSPQVDTLIDFFLAGQLKLYQIIIYNRIARAFDEYDIVFENPPPVEENQGELCYIPDGQGNIKLVNTTLVMSEKDTEYFEPRFNVRMELYTRQNPRQPQLLVSSNPDSLRNSNFNRDRPTRFVVHGWFAGGLLTRPFSDGNKLH